MAGVSDLPVGVADAAALQSLQRITDAGLAYLSEDELLHQLLQRIAEILVPDTVAILLLEGGELHARAAKGIEEEVERGVRIPLGRGFAGRIAAECRPIAILDVDHADILNPILREKGIRSLLGVPLLVEDRVIGVLHVGSLTTRRFTDGETDLLQLAADRAALTIERARLYEHRRVAGAMQRQLLPEMGHPSLNLDSAGRYMPAAGGSLGGDWYDLFPLDSGRMALVVGDVVGHGVEAAAAMGQLRTALRAYAVEGHPPGTAVERINDLMLTLGPEGVTTLAFLVIDPGAETLEFVSAGHPPPLVIGPGGDAAYLEPQAGIPLGALAAARYESTTLPFPTGSIVLLYTDGLVEDRHELIDVGLERLRAIAAGAGEAEALCRRIVERMVPESPPDDIAFIAARVPPLPEALDTRWPAQLDSLAAARDVLRRWLPARGADADEAFDILVASQEACTNAVEHAYGPGTAEFELRASVDAGRVRIAIRDHGHWRAPRGADRGRGLALMRALTDDVSIRRDDDGTEVVLTRLLRCAA
jgi:anti-sigma regulatory factor (Ser/Thr protein kinase)/putative methionine-R-sulfoxide reductase with GAF domain